MDNNCQESLTGSKQPQIRVQKKISQYESPTENNFIITTEDRDRVNTTHYIENFSIGNRTNSLYKIIKIFKIAGDNLEIFKSKTF